LIKQGLQYKRMANPTSMESVIIKLKMESSDIIIINVYDSPDSHVDETSYRQLFQSFHRNAIILGDFNAHGSVFGAKDSEINKRGMFLEELLDIYNMVPLNTGAGTYVKHSGELSRLDIAMTTPNLARVINWKVLNDTLGSDHLVVEMVIKEKPVKEDTSISKWLYRRADWDGFKKQCVQLITSDVVDDDIDSSRDRLVQTIIEAAEVNIPVTNPVGTGSRHRVVPFWTEECTAAIKKRNKAKNKMQRTKDLEDRKEYFRLRGVAQHIIKTAEKTYWQAFCSTMDKDTKASKVWGTIKKLSGVRSQQEIPTITDDGITYDTNQSKAELLAKKFAAVSSDNNFSQKFQTSRVQIEEEWKSVSDQPEVPLDINLPFEMHELVDAVRQCKRKSAPGPDRISYEMLKNIPRICLPTILRFFNLVWTKRKLPPDWKTAVVMPLLKPDKPPYKAESYRPVALTNTLCKVMERMVANRLRWWLETNNLYNKAQSGFRKGRSTIDQIIRLADDAHKAINNRHYTLAVMLDLTKAFDMVWHRGLLHKIKGLGLQGNILSFIEDFLTGRTIQVRVGNNLSSSYHLENGTPQGSVISPLLFLLMINDIDDPVNGERLSLYADDSAIWKSGANLTELVKNVQSYLDKLKAFFDRWGFKVSEDKTVAIVFTRNKKYKVENVKLTMNGKDIKVENTARFLGVTFDKKLTWKPHIDKVVEKCNKRMNILRVLSGTRWGSSKAMLLIVYKAMIRSVIDYGSIAYDTASNSTKSRLDEIQAKALRICCGALRGTPTSALQVECGQPPLRLRRLRMMTDYAIKMQSIPDHPATHVMEDCWSIHYGRYDTGREPFQVKTVKVLKRSKVKVYPKVLTKATPWKRSIFTIPVLKNVLKPHRDKVRKTILDTWQEEWDYCSTGRFYNEIQPIVDYKVKFTCNPRAKEVLITRFRLGHACLNNFLYRMRLKENSECELCKEEEDVEHFLIECSSQQELQNRLQKWCTENSKKYNVQTILRTDRCLDIIYDFITTTKRFS